MKKYIVVFTRNAARLHGKKQTQIEGYDEDDALFRAGIKRIAVQKIQELYC